jgi:hypothetical protein
MIHMKQSITSQKKDLKNERKPTIWTFKEQAEYNTQESKNFATL